MHIARSIKSEIYFPKFALRKTLFWEMNARHKVACTPSLIAREWWKVACVSKTASRHKGFSDNCFFSISAKWLLLATFNHLFLSYSNSSFCTLACLHCCFFHPAFECHHLLHNNTGHTHSPQPSPQLLRTLGNFRYGNLVLIEKKMKRSSWNTKLITDSQKDGFSSFCGSFCSGWTNDIHAA